MNTIKFNVCPMDASTTTPVVRPASCTLTLTFTAIAQFSPKWQINREPSRNAGRVQIGEQVSLFTQCVPGGKPIQPDSPGTVRIYGGSRGVRSSLLPVETTDNETVGLFRGTFQADNSDSPGRYIALFAFQTTSVPRAEVVNFELLPGGHQLGAVMSTFSADRPDNVVALAHTESGKVTTGRGPYLDEGV